MTTNEKKRMKRGNNLSKEQILELYKKEYPVQPKSSNYSLNQARNDEIIFVLRETDETAPWVILEWIRENIHTAPEDKIRSAFEQALAMRKADDRRRAT